MLNPCSPIIHAGTAAVRAIHRAVVHKASLHTTASLHAPAAQVPIVHAPVFGPPAPQTAALCSRTPGTTLATTSSPPAGGAAPAASPVATDPGSSTLATAPGTASGSTVPSAVPGFGGGSVAPAAALPAFGAAKSMLLATALVAGLGTVVVQATGTAPVQPTPDSVASPDDTPDVIPLTFALPSPQSLSGPGPFIRTPSLAQPNIAGPVAVPEPASLLTLGLGAALASLAQRRRQGLR